MQARPAIPEPAIRNCWRRENRRIICRHSGRLSPIQAVALTNRQAVAAQNGVGGSGGTSIPGSDRAPLQYSRLSSRCLPTLRSNLGTVARSGPNEITPFSCPFERRTERSCCRIRLVRLARKSIFGDRTEQMTQHTDQTPTFLIANCTRSGLLANSARQADKRCVSIHDKTDRRGGSRTHDAK